MAKKPAKKAKRTTRKKGLNLGVLRRAAKSRIKKLKANIKKRDKAITRARREKDRDTVAEQLDMRKKAQTVMRGLEGMVKTMNSDTCPFAGQGDPLA